MKDLRELPRSVSRPTNNKCFHITGPSHDKPGLEGLTCSCLLWCSIFRNSAMRKINELVKRTRLLRVHACLIGYLKEQMPMFMGREKMQERLLKVGPITPCLYSIPPCHHQIAALVIADPFTALTPCLAVVVFNKTIKTKPKTGPADGLPHGAQAALAGPRGLPGHRHLPQQATRPQLRQVPQAQGQAAAGERP